MIFISHAREDEHFMEGLVARLQRERHHCWFYEDSPLINPLRTELRAKIRQSSLFVLILSPVALASEHVRREIGWAIDAGKPLLVITLGLTWDDVRTFETGTVYEDLTGAGATIQECADGRVRDAADGVLAFIHAHSVALPDAVTSPCEASVSRSPQETSKPQSPRLWIWNLGVRAIPYLLLVPIAALTWLYRQEVVGNDPHAQFRGKVAGNWLVYDPTDWDPYDPAVSVTRASIRRDLDVLAKHGFDRIVTCGSKGDCAHIAEVAKSDCGFEGVVVGVWDPMDAEEVVNALAAQEWADAYCIGHRGLHQRYTMSELVEAIERFKRTTDVPVATCELLADYRTPSALAAQCDFLFPDVHTYWYDGTLSPEKAWEQTVRAAEQLGALAGDLGSKPVLLNMVSYPSDGAPGLTLDAQRRFYELAVLGRRDRSDIPGAIGFAFLGAFDTPWKTAIRGFQPADQHTGLLTNDRRPKPAIADVNWRERM
ncbi:MAG TPA: hypothetical protein DGT21_24510 [Armatimonadetes bacterium]|jgi:exo-beta-1,3-glucanase (GH17 family)|nr:hypothetical protein [Armatimonadota bacterium]